MPRIAIIFYSTYGTNRRIAQIAADAAKAAGAEVRLRRIPETAPRAVVERQGAWREQLARMQDIPELSAVDMEWADGYFITGPTRFGVSASQLRAFIDTLGPLWQKGALANKSFTAATTAQNAHGGQEATLLSLYTTAMHWGAIIVAPGYTDAVKFEDGGNPYGFSARPGELEDTAQRSIGFQARRLVEVTAKLTGRAGVKANAERVTA